MRAAPVVLLLITVGVARAGEPTPWALAKSPAPGPAQAIGRYGGGCIQGAARLPLEGKGFRVARPERGRLFGHPLLVAMVRELGGKARALGLPFIAVGDPTPLRESEHLRVPALCLAKHAARARIRWRPSLLFEEVEEHESG